MPRDLGLTALSTLSRLERAGPQRLTDLARVERVAQPSMTTLVTNLERSGYAERKRGHNDGRVTLVAITRRGSAFLAERRQAGAAVLDGLIAQLSDDDRAALVAAAPAIDRLRALVARQRDQATAEGASQ